MAGGAFSPETLDDDAQRRLGLALSRLETMASCDAGDETACQAMGPGPLTYTTEQVVSGDQAVVIEEADYKLTLWTETDPVTGEQTRHLLYEDADGTYMSRLSSELVELTSAPGEVARARAEGRGRRLLVPGGRDLRRLRRQHDLERPGRTGRHRLRALCWSVG